MLNKILLYIIFFLFSANICFAVSKFIPVEATGISIINNDNTFSRDKAIKDAFQKALKKVIVNYNIEVDEDILSNILTNPEKYITGYELIEEKQVGNILNEKLKVNVDIQEIFKSLKVKTRKRFNHVYLLSYCYKNSDNDSKTLDRFCDNVIKNNLKNINNIVFLSPPESYDEIFNTQKDILVTVSYKILDSKKLYSINKEFDNIQMDITVYNSSNDIVKTFNFAEKVVSPIDSNPLAKIKPGTFNSVDVYIKSLKDNILKNKQFDTSKDKYYFIVKRFSNYNDIKNLEKFFQKFNINFTLTSIQNKTFIYKIEGISENEIAKTIKFSDLDYNYIEIGDNITLSFD